MQCEGTLSIESLLTHYRKDCLESNGVSCSAQPFCKIVGTRRVIQEHELVCPNMKVVCEKCENTVIRKLIPFQHDCFTAIFQRLQKMENTLEHSYRRFYSQRDCRDKFDNVILNCKKKLVSLNK